MFILFLDHENICIDTEFMVLQFLVFEIIMAKVGYSVIAVPIYIFMAM